MLYFAYGSNMLKSRLEERLGPVSDLGIATLSGFKLTLGKESKDGTGIANIRDDEIEQVLGVVYELQDDQINKLDRFEVGYLRISVSAKINNEQTSVETYIAVKDSINKDLKPSEDYMQFINWGLKSIYYPLHTFGCLKRYQ